MQYFQHITCLDATNNHIHVHEKQIRYIHTLSYCAMNVIHSSLLTWYCQLGTLLLQCMKRPEHIYLLWHNRDACQRLLQFTSAFKHFHLLVLHRLAPQLHFVNPCRPHPDCLVTPSRSDSASSCLTFASVSSFCGHS